MRHRTLFATLVVISLALFLQHARAQENTLAQVSTIGALMNGVYDGEMSIAELKRHGTMGLGTFNGLDGELIALDGTVYQIRADGSAHPAPDDFMTPFAAVTFFQPERTLSLKPGMAYCEFEKSMDSLIPTRNIFYAFVIKGMFGMVRTRSVPRQEKPYRPLVEVVKEQPEFHFRDTEGTMVGFRCPSYAGGVNVPGYHLHFLTADLKAGGHVLDFRTTDASVQIDGISRFFLLLPHNKAFSETNLEEDRREQLTVIEKQGQTHGPHGKPK